VVGVVVGGGGGCSGVILCDGERIGRDLRCCSLFSSHLDVDADSSSFLGLRRR